MTPFMMQPQLPKDGRIQYIPAALDPDKATVLFDHLMETLPWQPDELIMFGKRILTQRRVVWVGDPECCYTYSGIKRVPQPWTAALLSTRRFVEDLAGCTFNACLINFHYYQPQPTQTGLQPLPERCFHLQPKMSNQPLSASSA